LSGYKSTVEIGAIVVVIVW